jgi:hypothetical protein
VSVGNRTRGGATSDLAVPATRRYGGRRRGQEGWRLAHQLTVHRNLVAVALFAGGYLVAIPALAWTWRDVTRIPRRLWRYSASHRRSWRRTLLAAYACLGWPAIAVAFTWWRSTERAGLLDAVADGLSREHTDANR